MGSRLNIRRSTDADNAAIGRVHKDAFGQEEGPEIVDLVNDLFSDATAQPVLSLVADTGGTIVGHILFTRATLEPDVEGVRASLLAPLAVSRDFQAQGVGGLLITEGLRQLAESGVDLVFVLGHPAYYPKHGFQPAGALGLEATYPISPEHADAWMVQALREGVIGHVHGRVQCAAALDQPRHWQE
jgi:predicted N-acetyltransferase YhbS